MLTILTGDCRDLLKTIPDQSVQCCVTSPPYWGLRDYGCSNQIGLEDSPELYVETMRQVFSEVRRVLKDDGTLWINLGDSYFGGGRGGNPAESEHRKQATNAGSLIDAPKWNSIRCGLKSKDLVGIPWRVAFALQADGWYLRQDIIWHKPNPMPESVTDRCTKAHEYVFLMSKSARYYYDHEAIQENGALSSVQRLMQPGLERQAGSNRVPGKTNGAMKAVGHLPGNKSHRGKTAYDNGDKLFRTKAGLVSYCDRVNENPDLMMKRNKRSVWTVTTQPYKEAHFATYPPDLIKPCIMAGTKPGDTVLDPFGGSGTTGQVALELGRRSILIELNPEYVEIMRCRTNVTPGLPIAA